ncbi:hypothetical protein ABEW34_07685 [Paenibacillus algorifonticola]|uniref:hypothetical protein n=1 Tax=Paenibacillus algorifonticola TaxID=684063 RepID=UPI003D2A4116
MDKYGDWLIMLVASALLILWLFRLFHRWLHEPASFNRLKLGKGVPLDPNDENILFLEQSGYHVVSGKHRIPIQIDLDGQELDSRLYIDYIAELDGELYVVKTARDRMPMDWTGSGIRDRLLVYALLLPKCQGILFINVKERSIRKVVFQL